MKSSSLLTLVLLSLGLLSVGCTSARVLNSNYTSTELTIDGDISDWPRDRMQLENNAEFDAYFANDGMFLYMYLVVKSQQLYNDLNEYGLRLYVDRQSKPKRMFGLIYPIGVLNYISPVPGARQEYIENPGWAGFPENRQLLERYQEERFTRAMLIQRSNRSDQERPADVLTEVLQAQGIQISHDPDARLLNLEVKIPLQPTRSHPFAIETEPGETIFVGIEVKPPGADEILQEAGSVLAEGQGGSMRQQQELAQRMQLRGEFSRWMQVSLAEAP